MTVLSDLCIVAMHYGVNVPLAVLLKVTQFVASVITQPLLLIIAGSAPVLWLLSRKGFSPIKLINFIIREFNHAHHLSIHEG